MAKLNLMHPRDAARLITRAERLFHRAAQAYNDAEGAGITVQMDASRAAAGKLITSIGVEVEGWTGLYPTFKAVNRSRVCHSIAEAYDDRLEQLDDRELRRWRAWRALRQSLKRGTEVGIVHTGNRGRVRFVVASQYRRGANDITFYMRNLMGYRWSEKGRCIVTRDADLAVANLALEMFGNDRALERAWL